MEIIDIINRNNKIKDLLEVNSKIETYDLHSDFVIEEVAREEDFLAIRLIPDVIHNKNKYKPDSIIIIFKDIIQDNFYLLEEKGDMTYLDNFGRGEIVVNDKVPHYSYFYLQFGGGELIDIECRVAFILILHSK